MLQIKHTNKQSVLSRNFSKILFVFAVVMLPIFIFSTYGPAASLLSSAMSPFLKAGDYFYSGLSKVPKIFSSKSELLEENRRLMEELGNSDILRSDYESIKYENQKLREDLMIKPSGDFMAAMVLARPPQVPLDSMVINKGSDDGLKEGDMVLAGERTLIGKIAKISKNRSNVVLNSFAEVISYGYVARTEEPIEVKGDGGGNIQARVPIDFDIKEGDKIMVGGSASFAAAIVGIIEKDESLGFKEVFMSLPVSVSKINTVFVEPFINE